MKNSPITRFGIHAGDGLQSRSWSHNLCSGFRCVLCDERAEMNFASTTLFDGQDQLGDLCEACIVAGPSAAASRAQRRAKDLREMADDLDDLAKDLSTLDPARWSALAELRAEEEQVMKEMHG